jgi:hypothetical protein
MRSNSKFTLLVIDISGRHLASVFETNTWKFSARKGIRRSIKYCKEGIFETKSFFFCPFNDKLRKQKNSVAFDIERILADGNFKVARGLVIDGFIIGATFHEGCIYTLEKGSKVINVYDLKKCRRSVAIENSLKDDLKAFLGEENTKRLLESEVVAKQSSQGSGEPVPK